jgi:ubiquinone/menaquinone biosynthesis C-methylase UbiE
MSSTPDVSRYWLDIDPERLERYDAMFQWSAAAEPFYAPARIGAGHVVADFGCGPGHAAIEFAKRVGAAGHVHALDINAEFIERIRSRAEAQGLGGRVTAHLLEDARLLLPDAGLDRIVARNTIVYVADPAATFAEFRRVLRPGGLAHAIEGDWSMTAVEPVPTADWRALIEAASWAWPRPQIGRELHGLARRAGFREVSIQVLTSPDATGRLTGMIKTVADYARSSNAIAPERIDDILQRVEDGLAEGTYLAIVPQFIVTATA